MPPRPRKRGGASISNSKPTGNKPSGNARSKNSNPRRQHMTAALFPQPSNEDPSTICTVCANKAPDWAIGPCNHVVCGDCAHRMRVLYHRETCVICSRLQKHLVVVPLADWREGMTYADAMALPSLALDNDVNMSFVDRSRLAHFRDVRSWMCSHKACASKPAAEKVFNNATQLRGHARSEHRAVYCEICFTSDKAFVSELQQFTLDTGKNSSGTLRSHLRKIHPQCRFCRQYYLDDDKLYSHLQEAHETCSICERNGRIHEYYVNFAELERHYAREHYVCNQESCRGVVFATAIDLQTHIHTRHSGGASNSGGGGGGGGARARALRVNLQQLHEGRDPRGGDDVAVERERQAARRRAFLSSHVIFSGAFNLDDETADTPEPASTSAAPTVPPVRRDEDAGTTTVNEASATSATAELPPRPPDDGRFHPSRIPRDAQESSMRNTALVRRMRSLLDPAAYEQFKQSSARFQDGSIDTDTYYDAAVDAFGVRTAVRDVLPELVALLPSPLLREPLLRTCLHRTDTPFTEADLDPAVSALASLSLRPQTAEASHGTSAQQDQFPTLNGAPAPPPSRAVTRARRFGALGPDEFPRLGRANPTAPRPAATPAVSTAPTPAASSNAHRSSVSARGPATTAAAPVSAPLPKPAVPASAPRGGGAAPKTAASVLREGGPASVRVFGNRSALSRGPGASTSGGGGGSSGGARFEESAFPSLVSSAASPAVPTGRDFAGAAAAATKSPATLAEASNKAGVDVTSAGNHTSNGGPSGHDVSSKRSPAPLSETAFPPLAMGGPSAFPGLTDVDMPEKLDPPAEIEDESVRGDVSLRAGAVWGGATRGGRGKKRGVGLGRMRRPATPPPAALQRMSEAGDSDGDVGGDGSASGGDGASSAARDDRAGSSTPRLKVIDVMAIAKERRRAIEQSSLPSFAKSAHGYASAGKKSQRKR